MPSLFDITAAATRVNLDQQRRGEISFTVTNTSGRSVRGRARVVPQGAASADWFVLEGQAERNFDVAGAQQYTVQIAVAPAAPNGSYLFRLDMVGVENPDEFYTEGPAVAFDVSSTPPPPPPPPPPVQKGYITTVVGGVVGLLAGITAGIILAIIALVILNPISNDLAGIVGIGILALGPWIGSSVGAYIALNTRNHNWPRETGGVFAAVIFAWTIVCFLLLLAETSIFNGAIEAIIAFFIILPLWLIGPGMIARAIVLRWKTGSF